MWTNPTSSRLKFKRTKTTQTKVTVECFRHRTYSDPKDAFRKRFSSQATVADHVVRQTLRDNGASSRGSKGKSMTRKSKSRRSMKKEDCCPFWFAIVCSISVSTGISSTSGVR
ncbi:MAG: hypothetical protein ACREBR_04050 [bacterium]